jgi:uncharacterized protein (UPF0332 family)
VLTPEQKQSVARSLRLAQGLVETVDISALSSEYEIRNSLSRLYYAFFHASLALLLTAGRDIEGFRKDHGRVHDAVQVRFGKYFGAFLRNLYRLRRESDYDAVMFERTYGGDIENARKEFILFIKKAKTNFHWLYREARKAL